MHLFYTPDLEMDNPALPKEESRHCAKVLRLKPGDRVQMIDGIGTFYEAELKDVAAERCKVEILETHQKFGLLPYQIHIAVAPTKNIDRMEWLVEKATEIGIQQITFLQCQRSERKQVNLERLEKIAISAMKQSGKAYLPQISGMVPFKFFLGTIILDQTFIAHLEEGKRFGLKDIFTRNSAHCILIGPEGDFSPAEIEMAYARGIRAVSLGASRLRTETAALVACHTLHVLQEVL